MPQSTQIKLLYDGQCPLCSREIEMLKRLDRGRNRLAFEDLSRAGFSPEKYGLTMDQVIGEMHAVQSDGSVLRGMPVFREAYRAVGLGWLIAPTGWPIVRPLFDLLYAGFARVRPRLSRFRGVHCKNDRCAPSDSASAS